MPSSHSCVCACVCLSVCGPSDCLYNRMQAAKGRTSVLYLCSPGWQRAGPNKLVNKVAFAGSRLTLELHKEISVSRGQHKVDRFTIKSSKGYSASSVLSQVDAYDF